MDVTSPQGLSAIGLILVVLIGGLIIRSSQIREFLKDQWLRLAFFLATVVGLIVVWSLMSKEDLTPFESQVFNFLLFMFSVAASWVFSKIYSEQGASKSLRDYSVQVARGVMVLKSQLEVLTYWVEEKRTAVRDPVTDAHLEHVEETLKGFRAQADATLRGIAGVMGDALKQYQDTMDEINNTRTEATKEAAKLQAAMTAPNAGEFNKAELTAQLQALELRTTQKIEALSQRSSLPISIPQAQKIVTVDCPACHHANEIAIADGSGQTRSAKCPRCDARFNVHSSGTGEYFTRLIGVPLTSTGVGEPATIYVAGTTAPEPVPGLMAVAGVRMTKPSFTSIAHAIAAIVGASQDRHIQCSIADVQAQLINMRPQLATGLSVRQLMKMLFWSRLFQFTGPPSFKSPIANRVTPEEVAMAFCRSAGHRFFALGVPIENLPTLQAVAECFGAFISDGITPHSLLAEFTASYKLAQQGTVQPEAQSQAYGA